ncbi:hypothetical protein [Streptomyces silvisoli]|uniref:Uncharacterized protein n=1 Tax=Streptomyces silvisoli TaxID=3034235 RepID=A0ABT5ZS45_9ACTN|nr:hypothetical protein [Streptomyces silvisoli]MDF3292664.1 hypothetical protein [Streptomyces silvisoli]
MYIGPQPDTARAGLRLAHVDHLVFGQGGRFHELDYTYFRDLWRLFGLPWDDTYLTAGRTTFHDMIETVLERLGPLVQGLDAAVLANATPDAEPGFPMPYIEHALGGIGTVFAVSDQGAAATFTALRLAAHTLPPGANGRALVVVMDQARVLSGPPMPDDIRPLCDSAVALVLEGDGRLGVPEISQHVGVPTSEIVGHLSAAAGQADRVTAICRPELAPYWAKADVAADLVPVPGGLPCTGPWAALAKYRATAQKVQSERVVLADYDARLKYLSVCGFDMGAPR